jgi:hypothetical protein
VGVGKMIFNNISLGFTFGKYVKHFSLNTFDAEITFNIFKNPLIDEVYKHIVKIEYVPSRHTKTLKITDRINSKVVKVFYKIQNDKFNTNKKRKYEILQFMTESKIINIGYYVDNLDRLSDEEELIPYIICSSDKINMMSVDVEITEQNSNLLEETCFSNLRSLFEKKEMAKLLIN